MPRYSEKEQAFVLKLLAYFQLEKQPGKTLMPVNAVHEVIIWLTYISTMLFLTSAIVSNIYAPLHLISLNDITPDERRQIALLEQKLERAKRSGGGGSGSGEILNLLKNAIGNGIKKKIGQIATASAASSGTFSKTSSSGKGKEYYHHPPPHYVPYEAPAHSDFDFWGLKKSILNTLLQAVKAIKGGVLAIKGQLIKGGGKLVSASGNLVSYQGESITELGKMIATKAILVPYHSSSGKGTPHATYEEVGGHHSAPSAPEIYQTGPSGSEYHVPDNYPPPHRDGAAGLLILKKVGGSQNNAPSINSRQSFSPSMGNILGKFFSASSSYNPNKPELFGEENQVKENINSYQAFIVPPRNMKSEVVPSASGTVNQEVLPPKTFKPPTEPSPSYDSPFEESPNYLNQNFDNFLNPSSINQIKTVPQSFSPHKSVILSAENNEIKDSPNNKPIYYQLPVPSKTANFPADVDVPISVDSMPTDSLKDPPSMISENLYKPTPSFYLETPKQTYPRLPPSSLNNAPLTKTSYGLSALDKFRHKQPSPSVRRPSFEEALNYNSALEQDSSIDLIPSIAYSIGPFGPKRLN